MAKDLVGAVASAVVSRLMAANGGALCNPGDDAAAVGGADTTDEFDTLIDGLSQDDIEAIASQLADELAPLLDREELPADKVEI